MLFYSLSDMCKGIGDETLYTVYTKSVNGETALRLRPFEEAVKQLSMAGFEGIALASGSGRVVFATGVFDGYFQDYGFELQPSEASSVRIVNEGEGHYACSVRDLGATGYYLGAFVDFTGQQKISDSLAREIAVILIVTGAVVGVLFLLYSFWGRAQRKFVPLFLPYRYRRGRENYQSQREIQTGFPPDGGDQRERGAVRRKDFQRRQDFRVRRRAPARVRREKTDERQDPPFRERTRAPVRIGS